MKKGSKVVVMEDLTPDAVDSAVFFGPGNPNNWNRDLPKEMAKAPGVDAAQVAETTFRNIARIHARFWKDEALLKENMSWLRGQQWLQGQGKTTWEASQNLIRSIWKSPENQKRIQWDPFLLKVTDKVVKGISWEAQLKRLSKNGAWTLSARRFLAWQLHVDDPTRERGFIQSVYPVA